MKIYKNKKNNHNKRHIKNNKKSFIPHFKSKKPLNNGIKNTNPIKNIKEVTSSAQIPEYSNITGINQKIKVFNDMEGIKTINNMSQLNMNNEDIESKMDIDNKTDNDLNDDSKQDTLVIIDNNSMFIGYKKSCFNSQTTESPEVNEIVQGNTNKLLIDKKTKIETENTTESSEVNETNTNEFTIGQESISANQKNFIEESSIINNENSINSTINEETIIIINRPSVDQESTTNEQKISISKNKANESSVHQEKKINQKIITDNEVQNEKPQDNSYQNPDKENYTEYSFLSKFLENTNTIKSAIIIGSVLGIIVIIYLMYTFLF